MGKDDYDIYSDVWDIFFIGLPDLWVCFIPGARAYNRSFKECKGWV